MSNEQRSIPETACKVIVGWNKVAAGVVDLASGRPAEKIVRVAQIKSGSISLHEFNTPQEAAAFMLGISMARGWANPLAKFVNIKTGRII